MYTAKMHPKVKNGTMTEDQVFKEFLQGLGDKDKDGKISKEVNFALIYAWCELGMARLL